MLIKSIEFKNYRQFKDSRFVFSTNSNKNVTVILGDNTHGKTTIVRGFLWCLYKTNVFDDKILLNEDVATTMLPGKGTAEVKVVVEIEHADCSYIITTKESYIRSPSSGSIVVSAPAKTSVCKTSSKDGNTVPIYGDQASIEIGNILRYELSPYFFFDGESNKIDEISDKSNLNEAITDILGMRKKETLFSYFDSTRSDNVVMRFNNKLSSKNEDIDLQLTEQLDDAKDKYQQNLDSLKSNQEQIAELNKQLKDKEAELDSIKEIMPQQEEKKGLTYQTNTARIGRDNDFQSMINLLNINDTLFKYLLSYSFIRSDIKELYKNSTYSSNKDGLSNIDEKAIDQIIERGYCICGAKIENENDAYKHLINQKNFIAPRNYGKAVNDFIYFSDSNADYSKTSFKNVTNKASNVINYIGQIENSRNRIKQIESLIIGKKDGAVIQNNIIEIKGQIGYLSGRIENISDDQIGLERRINDLSKQIADNTDNNENNIRVKKCIDYSSYVGDYFKNKIASQKQDIRIELERRVQEIFSEMYSGSRRVCIDSNFRVTTQLLYGSKKKLDESKGLETVKNFAFVGGLISLAKEQLNRDEEDESEPIDEAYPLVMDAPFSNCDENHIRRICQKLPSLCNQVIIIVMKKDFKNSDVVISDKVGKKYEIIKESESYVYVKEE